MFDPSTVHTYRSVKAPDELRERVLGSAIRPIKTHRFKQAIPLLAIAACLIVLFIGGSLRAAWQSDITITPQFLAVADGVSHSREHAVTADIVITTDGSITVSEFDAQLTPLINGAVCDDISAPVTATDIVTLRWFITSDTAEMTVNGRTYTLCADLNNGRITVQ